ncbi:hypothetical protein R3P38DRAFT_2791675 [Favolaschia claudopus]|uniref:Uncharacterized protein n=1 Tax=Favolaschia claudopus TaxID=2862362 RepID=A0AAW0AGP0_9AGAR
MTSIRSSLTQFVDQFELGPSEPPPLFPSHRNNNMTQPKKGRINNKNKDPSAAAEAKRIASATYYRQNPNQRRHNSGKETNSDGRETRRAQIKANRRKSDKSRPKKNALRNKESNSRGLADAEKESTEVLASRSRSPARPGHADRSAFGVEDEDEDSDEFEEGMGMRTISEVAGDPHGIGSAPEIDWELSPITRQEQVSQEEQASDVPIPASSSL